MLKNLLRKLWRRKITIPLFDFDLDQIATDLDFALGTYKELLESDGCAQQALDIALERIEDLHDDYLAAKLERLNKSVR